MIFHKIPKNTTDAVSVTLHIWDIKKRNGAMNPRSTVSLFTFLFLPGIYHLAYIHGVDAGREITVHILWHVVSEALRVKRCLVHLTTFYHHRCLFIIRCAVGSVGGMQAKCLCLVAVVATTLMPHIVQHTTVLYVKHHHGEILLLVEKLLSITLLRGLSTRHFFHK